MAIPDFDIKNITKCTVRNLNMIEELGEIEYLFCDKTGTLTQNILEFKAVAFP
jgi:P-type E1-E2 ATPase